MKNVHLGFVVRKTDLTLLVLTELRVQYFVATEKMQALKSNGGGVTICTQLLLLQEIYCSGSYKHHSGIDLLMIKSFISMRHYKPLITSKYSMKSSVILSVLHVCVVL